MAKSPAPPTVLLDMGAARVARQETKAAEVIRIGDVDVVLPIELPIDVFGPLKNLDVDLALLMRQAISGVTASGDEAKQAQNLVIDLLVSNPNLPRDLIDAISESARRVLGDEGFDALVAFRPSREDLGVLAKSLFAHYGVSLGEASGSSDSSTSDGTTSKPTSSGSTDSTPEVSSETPPIPAS